MSGRRIIVEESDGQDLIFGIAADVRSWKLSYELNKILGIQLKNAGESGLSSSDSPPSSQTSPRLFEGFSAQTEMFEDPDSHPGQEYLLYTKESQKLPPEARPFRFFLLIRSTSGMPVQAGFIKDRLSESPYIASVVNFSDYKNLQSLLP